MERIRVKVHKCCPHRHGGPCSDIHTPQLLHSVPSWNIHEGHSWNRSGHLPFRRCSRRQGLLRFSHQGRKIINHMQCLKKIKQPPLLENYHQEVFSLFLSLFESKLLSKLRLETSRFLGVPGAEGFPLQSSWVLEGGTRCQ